MAGREDAGWVYYDPTLGGNVPPAGGSGRRGSPRDPGGGGAAPAVSPRRMTIDDVSHTLELSGGGGGSAGPLRGFDSVYRGDHGWGHSWTRVFS